MTMLWVMAGGALGAALRYGLAEALNPHVGTGMPWGTLAVNLIGCALIGWLATALADASEPVRLGIVVGLLTLATCGFGGFVVIPMASFFLQNVAYQRGLLR